MDKNDKQFEVSIAKVLFDNMQLREKLVDISKRSKKTTKSKRQLFVDSCFAGSKALGYTPN